MTQITTTPRKAQSEAEPAADLALVPRSVAATSGAHAEALMALAAELFKAPDRVDLHCWIRFRRRFPAFPHSHDDTLQVGLAIGCAGDFTIGDETQHLRGVTLASCAYPREPHDHLLWPSSPDEDAQILGIKLRVERSWPIVRLRPFVRFACPVSGEVVILRAFKRMMRLTPAWETPGPVAIARVIEVLSMWPGMATQTEILDAGALENELEGPMRAALELIDRRLSNPPDVAELAAVAGLSPRHFARRFRQALGVTPHGLIDSRRLTRAKELLLQQDQSVADIAEVLGFDSLATFSRWFTKRTGTPPSRTRRGATPI